MVGDPGCTVKRPSGSPPQPLPRRARCAPACSQAGCQTAACACFRREFGEEARGDKCGAVQFCRVDEPDHGCAHQDVGRARALADVCHLNPVVLREARDDAVQDEVAAALSPCSAFPRRSNVRALED
jgi:hypothetical protein